MRIENFIKKYKESAKLSKIDLIAENLEWLIRDHEKLYIELAGEILPIFEEYLQFQAYPEPKLTANAGRCLNWYLRVQFSKLTKEKLHKLIKEIENFMRYVNVVIIQADFYAQLCFIELNGGDQKSAVIYGKKALNLLGNKPLPKSMKTFYSNYGLALIIEKNYQEAQKVLTTGLVKNIEKDKMVDEKLHMHLGLLYRDQGDFKNALQEFLIAEKLHSDKDISGTVILNINIASIYTYTGEYPKAIDILARNFELAENNDLDHSARINYLQSFNLFIGCSLTLQRFEDARKGLELFEFYMQKYDNYDLQEEFFRLAADGACAEGDYDKALSIYEKAYNIQKESDKLSIFFLQAYSNFLIFIKKFARVLEINEEILVMIAADSTNNIRLHSYEDMIKAYKGLNDHKNALELLEKVFTMQKKADNKELRNQIESLIEKNKKQQKQLKEREQRISLFNRNFVQEHNINFVGTSSAIKEVIDKALIAAQHPKVNILIVGESGTGKELIAKYIHYSSQVDLTVFQEVNCSAIPETMLESEFFGYKKGAFTGAVKDNPGFIASSDNGTLFLDEIGDLPLNLQPKLLKVLEERSFTPLGGNKAKKVTFRLISATNRDLQKMVKESTFRDDLFNRINSLVIEIPPLRKRKADIIPLVEHFLEQFTKEFNMLKPEIDDDTRQLLLNYSYPGNIRELKNIIERTMIFVRQGETFYNSLKKHGFIYGGERIAEENRDEAVFSTNNLSLENAEKQMILKALDITGNHKSKAAKLLDITPSSLTRRLKKFNI